MNSDFQNNINEQLRVRIIEYCCDSTQAANKEKTMEACFKIFSELDGVESVSLFLFNEETTSFIYDVSTGIYTKNQIQECFLNVTRKKNVSASFDQNTFCLSDCLPEKFVVVIPLRDQFGKVGLILLIMSRLVFNPDESAKELQLYTCHCALKIRNFLREQELAALKSTYMKKIISYTEGIAQSTRDLKKLLDTIQTGIILFDKNSGEIIEANIYIEKLIGLSKESIVGASRNDFFLFSEYRASEEITSNVGEKFIKKADGSIINVLSSMTEITLNNERYIAESIVDVSEQKKMENELMKAHDELESRVAERTKELSEMNIALQEQIKERIKAEEEKLKLYQAVHQSPAIIIITDLDGAIEYVNPIFTEITGYSFNEVKGMNPKFLKSGDVKTEEYTKLWERIKTGGWWNGEFRNKKKNGEFFWVSSFVSPIRNSQNEITNYLAIQKDITEKKIAEQKIIEAKERAEESDKLKTNLLANMSHELRTPMIGIMGFTQMLEDEIQDEEHLGILEQINQCSDRLMTTMNNVLSLSQLQSVDIKLSLEKIQLPELLSATISKFEFIAQQKGLEFIFTVENEETEVIAEYQLCAQLFSNIIDNAVKFTKKGSVSVLVNHCIENEMYYAKVTIKDTGIGISEHKRDRMFEPFRQESEGYSRSFEGLGLGLALAKRIVDLMNGKIFFEPNEPAGSIFTVILPLSNL